MMLACLIYPWHGRVNIPRPKRGKALRNRPCGPIFMDMTTVQDILLPAAVFGALIFVCTPPGARLVTRALKAMNLEASC